MSLEGAEKLGYNDEWFKYGFINEEFLNQQLLDSERNGFPDAEAYKWAAYCYVLNNQSFESEEKKKEFMELVEKDPNEHLWKGAVSELIERGVFTRSWLDFAPRGRISNWEILEEKLTNS